MKISNSNPISSIVKHFNLPQNEGFQFAGVLLKCVTEGKVDVDEYDRLAQTLFGDDFKTHDEVDNLMAKHIRIHRGLES
jgi:hypothetical protein